MNNLKNFFYNKNDILVGILIVIIAITVIYFRIGAIMNYPEKLQSTQQSTQVQETTKTDK